MLIKPNICGLLSVREKYIFEFKLNQTAEIALEQIREKEYFRKYQHSGREIVLVGANFDTVSRQISEWKSEIVC